jgi:hypothetical protein
MLTLAFPGPPPDTGSRDDVRGLGALLYALLTGVWPGGQSAPLSVLRPDLPRDLALIATMIVDDTSVGSIRTSGSLLRVLDQTRRQEPSTDPMPQVPPAQPMPARPPAQPVPAPPPAPPPEPPTQQIQPTQPTQPTQPVRPQPPARAASTESTGSTRSTKDTRRRRMALAAAGLTVATVMVAAWTISQIAGFFGPAGTLSATPAVLSNGTATVTSTPTSTSISHPAPPPTHPSPPPAAPSAAGPLVPSGVTEYTVSGSPDSPSKINRVIDGDPTTGWTTDTYFQQFPTYLPGLGIMVAFAQPVQPHTIHLNSPSAGTVVEIRAANSDDPNLADTQLLGTATLSAGDTPIALSPLAPTTHVLVWITALGQSGGGYQTTINEVTFSP